MNFPPKFNKKWRPLPIFIWAGVFIILAVLGVYGWTADEPAALELPSEEAFELNSVLKNSVARRDTEAPAPSPALPGEIVPKTVTPIDTVPFALPEDYLAEEVAEMEYPPLQPPVSRESLGNMEDFFVATRDQEDAPAGEELLPVAATPTLLGDLDKLAGMGEIESIDVPEAMPKDVLLEEQPLEQPVELPLESFTLEKPQDAPPVIVETEVPKPEAVKVPRLKKRTSANAKALRSRPTVGADPYQARPYYTPYVPTTGPGVLVLPR